jgi:predicted Fe-Mo cluster-binding NifX family protein
MKTAITVWGERVSPVFDSAQKLLIAEIIDKKVMNKQYELFDPDLPHLLAERLTKLNIEVFFCGAISTIPANTIELSGIQLISFISGDVNEILQGYAEGIPIIPTYLMPGCKCRHRVGQLSVRGQGKCKNDARRGGGGAARGRQGNGQGRRK